MVASELDIFSASTLEDSVHLQLTCRVHGLIIDLSELSFLRCAGVLVLNRAREAAQRKKVPLQLGLRLTSQGLGGVDLAVM